MFCGRLALPLHPVQTTPRHTEACAQTSHTQMDTLNLPAANLLTATRNGRQVVYDPLRSKYVALTPEEWVRQHFVHFLVTHKGYPAGLIANEMSITLGVTRKRCDTVVFGQNAQPLMIVEYKAPQVTLTQKVFDQICRYNIRLHVEWLIVSNGLQHYCLHLDCQQGTYRFLSDIPPYSALTLPPSPDAPHVP